jgi:predicted dehydrogenase
VRKLKFPGILQTLIQFLGFISISCRLLLFKSREDKYRAALRGTKGSINHASIMGSVGTSPKKVLGVGLVGCGEVCQTVHIPTLGHLSDYFRITYLCDVSADALQHCKSKVAGEAPETTRDVAKLCASPSVDVVFIANSNEYHAAHAIIALQHNKHVLVEKPASMNIRDADAIIAAEETSQGKVFVGYMRRYAAAFVDAIKEIGGVEKILYARVRGKILILA